MTSTRCVQRRARSIMTGLVTSFVCVTSVMSQQVVLDNCLADGTYCSESASDTLNTLGQGCGETFYQFTGRVSWPPLTNVGPHNHLGQDTYNPVHAISALCRIAELSLKPGHLHDAHSGSCGTGSRWLVSVRRGLGNRRPYQCHPSRWRTARRPLSCAGCFSPRFLFSLAEQRAGLHPRDNRWDDRHYASIIHLGTGQVALPLGLSIGFAPELRRLPRHGGWRALGSRASCGGGPPPRPRARSRPAADCLSAGPKRTPPARTM